MHPTTSPQQENLDTRQVQDQALPDRAADILAQARLELDRLSTPLVRGLSPVEAAVNFVPVHSLLLEVIDLAMRGQDPDFGLVLRHDQLVKRFGRVDQLSSEPESSYRASDEVFAYLRTAQRLLDALVLQYVSAGEELELATRRQAQRLSDSLSLRSAFAVFRLSVEASARRPKAIERLRYTAVALAALLGVDADYSLRASDREILRSIQLRIQATLMDPACLEDQEAVTRLLSDITTSGAVLAEINHREELRLHDTRLIGELPVELPEPQSASFSKSLRPLFGFFIDLDRCLSQNVDLDDAVYQQLLATAQR